MKNAATRSVSAWLYAAMIRSLGLIVAFMLLRPNTDHVWLSYSSPEYNIETNFPWLEMVFQYIVHQICSVITNNTEGVLQATRYLMDLGHQDIIY